MKINRAGACLVALSALLFAVSTYGGVTTTLTTPNGWKYLKGTNEPPFDWNTRGFDDSTWSTGSMPFYYGDGTNGTLLADMANNYSTLYLRYNFTNWAPNAITTFVFTVDYDDAFIVWINGGEAWRSSGAPGSPNHSSLSSTNHECSIGDATAQPVETHIIFNGTNFFTYRGIGVVAIQVFNASLGSSDIHLNAQMMANNMFVSNAVKVACVGDSLTDGDRASNPSFTAYPAVLQSMLGPGYEVRNYGRGGTCLMRASVNPASDAYMENAAYTPQWYESKGWQPDVVVTMLGDNDANTNRNWSAMKVNFTSEYDVLIASYTNHGGATTRPYICTQPWANTNGNPGAHPWGWDWAIDGNVVNLEMAPMTRNYASARGYTMIDVNAVTANHYPEWAGGGSDSIHFNDIGYSNIALAVKQAIAFQSTGSTSALSTNIWTAYDDTAWTANSGQNPSANDVTGNFTTNSPLAALSGTLVDASTATQLAAQVSFITNGAVGVGLLDRAFALPSGSDAATWFAGKIGTNCAANWTGGSIQMTVSGLDPARQFNLVLWSTRGADAAAYSNRFTDITLTGADAFVNRSSTGTELSTIIATNDRTRVRAALAPGYVARYDAVSPGSDGAVSFTLTAGADLLWPAGGAGTNGYLNAFMIQTVPTTSSGNSGSVPDAWKIQYFGTTNVDLSADMDGDGLSNLQEYIAGCTPTNAGSRPKIGIDLQSGIPTVDFNGVTQRLYSVDFKTNLFNAWTPLVTDVWGSNVAQFVTLSSSNAMRFYRFRVRLAP